MNALSSIVNLSSISCLKELTEKQIQALQSIGITRISDLLNFDPIKNAKMLMVLVKGDIVIDLNRSNILDEASKDIPIHQIASQPIKALRGIGTPYAKVFDDAFSIKTIEELASFKPYADAERIILQHSNEFSEPSSAPEALIPKIVGSVASQYSYSNFIKEKRLRFNDLELVFDNQRLYVDHRLISLFIATNSGNSRALSGVVAGAKKIENRSDSVQIPEVQVGYISKLTQKWINYGTHLGEVIHSLPLAPGESRNIAVIDWKRKQSSARKEDTKASEQLTNDLFHKRALDEVTRSAAAEHQQGGTDISAATIATAGAGVIGAALVGGVAGALPGAFIGGGIGAGTGGVVLPVVGAVPGVVVGAAAGTVIGFGAGAAIAGGAALVGAANAQFGTIQSDSSGDRGINAKLSQDIEESIKQKSSSIRSLWSSVIVTDEQAENENLTTRNVTNYNHSHALTIQYFEVLQHYKSEMCMTQAEPFLLLPFAPLEFDFDLIVDFWDILKRGLTDINLLNDIENLINNNTKTGTVNDQYKLDYITISVTRANTRNGRIFMSPEFPDAMVNLIGNGVAQSKRIFQNQASFVFENNESSANLTGVQIEELNPGENIFLSIWARMKDEHELRIVKNFNNIPRRSDTSGIVTYAFALVESAITPPEVNANRINEVVRHFNAHRYFFTRLLLFAIEKEQLIDVVESLILRSANPALNKLIKTVWGENYYTGDVKDKYNSNESGGSFSKSFMDFMRKTIVSLLTEITKKYEPLTILTIPRAAVLDSIHTLLIQVDEFISEISENQPKSDNEKKKITDEILKLTGAWFSKFTVFARDKKQFDENLKIRIAKVFASLDKFDSYDNFIHLSEFIDSTPFAITGNTIMFKMKKIVDKEVLANPLINNNSRIKELKEYPEDISNYLKSVLENKAQHTLSSDIYLPTSGVFAEAILGRSNASEKIDLTRYINWQDMPIPHLAPAINALNAGQHNVTQQDLSPTVPASVLNIMNPPALPDPTGMAGVLSAIQNGNIFRDMSKSDQLVTVMGNLSNLAQSMAQQAGSLAGQAQSDALKAATEIGKQVAQLASQAASQPANAPKSSTEKGGVANILEKFISGQNNGSEIQVPDEIKSILGIGRNAPKGTPAEPGILPFLNEKKNISDLIGDFSKSGLGELKLNNDGGNIEFKKKVTPEPNKNATPEIDPVPSVPGNEKKTTIFPPELSKVTDILNKAADSPEGITAKDQNDMLVIIDADLKNRLIPALKANAPDFEKFRPVLRSLLDVMATGELVGVGDELRSTTNEAMKIAEASTALSLNNTIDLAKSTNSFEKLKQAFEIVTIGNLLGFEDDKGSFDPSTLASRLQLSVNVETDLKGPTLTDEIKTGDTGFLKVFAELVMGDNDGIAGSFFGVGVKVSGGVAEPSATGKTDDAGRFVCNIICTDRDQLSISGIADTGIPGVIRNFEVNI